MAAYANSHVTALACNRAAPLSAGPRRLLVYSRLIINYLGFYVLSFSGDIADIASTLNLD
jgi:hypothetical protein